jgi:hypothetical protein
MLPARCDAEILDRLIDGLVRGRSLAAVRESGFTTKGFEGAASLARALGLAEGEALELTAAGRTYGLADGDARAAQLRRALRRYPPYAALLAEAEAGRLQEETEADWIARHWAAAGWGSSESNRAEAVSTFARLTEAAGVADFITGRRGRPSRLRWRWGPTPVAASPAPEAGAPAQQQRARPRADAMAATPAERSEVVFALGPGRTARLELPAALTPEEKQRLLTLIDVLVRAEPLG